MERTFYFTDLEGRNGKFRVSVTRKDGVNYRYIEGAEPSWKDLSEALTYVMAKMRIRVTEDEGAALNGRYRIEPDNRMDIRFVPVLIDLESKARLKLPLTVDGDEVLEHSAYMSFDTAKKVVLALSMSYGEKTLLPDKEKMKAAEHFFAGAFHNIEIV